jgi:hypothetical protein
LPALAPPPGAAGSEAAIPELARVAEQGAEGAERRGRGALQMAREEAGVLHLGAKHTKGSAAGSRIRLPEAQSFDPGKDQGPLGAGFRPLPTAPARVGSWFPEKR